MSVRQGTLSTFSRICEARYEVHFRVAASAREDSYGLRQKFRSRNSEEQPLPFEEAEGEATITPVEALGLDESGATVIPENPDETADNLDEVIPPHTQQSLPVVGIGGSAGAIPALREFFSLMTPDAGIAFVVVVHLLPDVESTLPEILQLETSMPVVPVTHSTRLEANHIYVISPNVHLSMMDGQILTQPLVPEHGRRVAVDLFFRTLADTHGSNATRLYSRAPIPTA